MRCAPAVAGSRGAPDRELLNAGIATQNAEVAAYSIGGRNGGQGPIEKRSHAAGTLPSMAEDARSTNSLIVLARST